MKPEDLIKQRRSVRSYQDKKIPKQLIKEILELANLAPTASEKQDRFFIIIEDQILKEKLYSASCKQSHLLAAPVIIAVVCDSTMFTAKELLKSNKDWDLDLWGATEKNYKKNKQFTDNVLILKKFWSLQDADTATTTLLLAATAKGLATCWIGLFDHEQAAKILKIPKNYEVTALVTLGYQKDSPYPQKRKKISELIHWNHW